MPKKLVRRGRVKGYRPSREQLESLLELAQRGMDAADTTAHLTYLQGDLEIYPHDHGGIVLPDHFAEIIKEAGEPTELNNLLFSVIQPFPPRRVEVSIGPGEWTTYRVESDDQTWAFGRYHELTDRLMADRCNYAKGTSASPQIIEERTDDKWRPAAWESDKGWLIALSAMAPKLAALSLLAGFLFVAYIPFEASFGPVKTKADRAQHAAALRTEHWLHTHSFAVFVLMTSCLVAIYAWWRWLRSSLISAVILRKTSLAYQFSFRNKRQDSLALASTYIALLTLIVTVIALILGS
jgi:hypothetical protein